MLPLLVIALLAQDGSSLCARAGERCRGPRAPRGGQAPQPLFQFAPTSGAGMGAACACSTVTGSRGEAITFSRSSSGTCLKGNVASGIANGDLVTCSTDQPRVMYGGAGTGALGLLVEGARTNSTLRSEALDNAAWASNNSGSGNPTITADFGVAPDGTTTAERLQIPATSGSQFSERYQLNGCPGAGVVSISLFAKSNSGTGTLDIVTSGSTAETCSISAGSWVWCRAENFTTTTLVEIGHFSNLTAAARGSDDLLIWGVQCEAGKYATSYIKTAGATVTRATEAPTFTLALANANGSMAASTALSKVFSDGDHIVMTEAVSGVGWKQILNYQSALTKLTFQFATGGSTPQPNAANTLNAEDRWVGYWTGTSATACFNATCASATVGVGTTTDTIELGHTGSAAHISGVIKKVCVDPSPSRCR